MKKLLLVTALISAPLFCTEFASKAVLEANTKSELQKLIPIYKSKGITKLHDVITDDAIIKSKGLMDELASFENERTDENYSVKEVKVKDELSSTYVKWFHTSDEQDAKDVYFKVSSKSRTYEYDCSIIYSDTKFHIAGCDVTLNGEFLDLEGITFQEECMMPIQPLYKGIMLSVYIDTIINYDLLGTEEMLRAQGGTAGRICKRF